MNTGSLSLPILPFSATRGVLPVDALPTPEVRRRYAQIVALALLEEPSWTIESWERYGDRREQCPWFLRARAVREGWPVGSRGQYGLQVTTLMRPVPLPESGDALIERAITRVPVGLRGTAREALLALWRGDYPPGELGELDEVFSAAIMAAAAQGGAARQAVFDAALARVRQSA